MCLHRIRSFVRLSSLFFAFEWQNKENEIRGRKKVLSYLLCMRTSRGWIYSWCIFLKYIHSIRNNHTRNFCRFFFIYFLHSGFWSAHYGFITKEIIVRRIILRMCWSWKKRWGRFFLHLLLIVCVIATRSKSIVCSSYLLNRNKKSFSLFIIICVAFVIFLLMLLLVFQRASAFCASIIKMSKFEKVDGKWN